MEFILNSIQTFFKKSTVENNEIVQKKYNIIFLNHKKQKCGVYQYGVRLFENLKDNTIVNHYYEEIESFNEYQQLMHSDKYHNFDIILYNYHAATMPWLNTENLDKKYTNIGIVHESNCVVFDAKINIDPTFQDCDKEFSIGRPLIHNTDEILKNHQPSTDSIHSFIHYKKIDIPVFGSFGFGQSHKKFEKIVKLVCQQYNEAIIKFVMPIADFIPNAEYTNSMVATMCLQTISKPGIQLMITHEFFTNEDILCFLNSNDMNIFLYESTGFPSSVTDYALSVNKPFGISNYPIFKHIYSNDVCLEETSIEECMKNTQSYRDKYLELYSKENMIKKFLYIYETIITQS